ncbi:hypothetical protein VTK73DRAFT_5452 [Phialemonium thermophilum]|uniref:Asparagine synthetase domain-containing protein n=1 Tax=Phialemonium thermophilum TaxID=223376 RepID=A0ABR3V1V4_9PEZI
MLGSSPLAPDEAKVKALYEEARGALGSLHKQIGLAEGDGKGEELEREVNYSQMLGMLANVTPELSMFSSWVQEVWAGVDARETMLRALPREVRGKMREEWHTLHNSLYLWTRSAFANVLLACLGDRTEMAHSIEARPPFLDHVLSEYVNALPPSVKLAYVPDEAEAEDDGANPVAWRTDAEFFRTLKEKWILREAAKPYITEELYKRKKHPYTAPTKWPRDGPLYRMHASLLTRENIEKLGFLRYEPVAEALDKAFGPDADGRAFRLCNFVSTWVVIGQRFGVQTARAEDWAGYQF